MDQPARRSQARCRAVLVTPLVVLGMTAGTPLASSAARLSHGPAARTPAAAAAPASLLAAIRTSLGAALSVAGYSQQAELTASHPTPGGEVGAKVALSASGRTALVGAAYGGAAYVFTLRRGTWSQTAELTASDGAPLDFFGAAVALSALGNTALVGADGRHSGAGAAYVFALRRGMWSQTAELTGAPGDSFGSSVALSGRGSTALIGAIGAHSSSGAAYVFALRHGRWSRTAELIASDGALNDLSGFSVALSASGSTALVGSPGRHTDAGAADVFTLRRGTWSRTAELTGAPGDGAGISVALSASGRTALVGASGRNSFTGAAYVFTLRRGTWSRSAVLTASNGMHADTLGNSVALSGLGSTALAGMYFRNPSTGAAYVFVLRHGTWSQTAELTASDAAPGDEFGESLALSGSGSTALVGAPFRANTGAVYVFAEGVRRLSA